MDQNLVLDLNITPRKYKEYPADAIEFEKWPAKEQEDLPDVIRWVDVVNGEPTWCTVKGEDFVKFLKEWKYIDNKEDVRVAHAYKSGGKMAENPKNVKKIRTIGKEFVFKVGKHLLSGHFNLTTVPFPIKVMVPKSYLEYVGCVPSAFFPLYLNLAVMNPDPVERFKLYIVSQICYFYRTTSFAKPLNPIIGETFTGYYEDGSRFYLEQISHHPPISYMLYYGPHEAYKFWGPSMFSASAGLNSLTLTTKAWRKITFKDNGQTIRNSLPNEYFDGTLLGTCVHSTIGEMEFVDEANNIRCTIAFGKLRRKATDYIEAPITVNGETVSTLRGTYLGWLEFDEKRYFDYRYSLPFDLKREKSPLASDVEYRPDKALLGLGYLDEAQKEKENLEHIQRTDAKMRKANGGGH